MKILREENIWAGFGIGCLSTSCLFFVLFISIESGGLNKMRGFFESYVDVFTCFGYVAVIISLIITFIQIALTKNQLKATLSYQIRKDSMDLLKSIEDNEIFRYIKSFKKMPICAQKQSLAERKIQELLQFYSSLHRQKCCGQLDNTDWEDMLRNFSKLLSYYNVRNFWIDNVRKDDAWRDDFKNLGEQFILNKEEKNEN